jgi:ketosteroid isomerase-like protein
MIRRPLLALPLAALLASCATAPPAAAPPAPGPAAVPIDLAQLEALAADQAFSRATVARDQAAFASFLAHDAVFVGPGGVSAGVAAVCADWAPLLAPGGPTLSWRPVSARGSTGGDLVVTQGTWALQPAGDGEARTGRYVTVWQRQPDGRLRVALDAPDQPLPPEAARAERRPLHHVLSGDGRLAAVAGRLLHQGREVGGYLLVEAREGADRRLLVEVGTYRPGP